MEKRGNFIAGKRGQFYLIAAIVLSAIIVGLSITSNYTTTNQNQNQNELNALSKQVQTESSKTVDYAINNSLNQIQINTLLQNMTQNYINSEKDKDLYFVYGTNSSVTINMWQDNATNVILDGNSITNSSGAAAGTITPSGSTIVLQIGSYSYSIGLKNGENFYFVISKEAQGERYVVSG